MSRLDLNSVVQPKSTIHGISEVNPQPAAAAQKVTVKPAPGDQASVSQAAGLVAQGLKGSDVRTAKVAALQQAIAAGTYKVPSGALADKLISTLLAGR